LAVLRLEVTAEISPAEIQVTANKRVLEDATCVAGFGGLSS